MKVESKFLDKQFEYFIILLGKTAISSVDIFHSENFYLCQFNIFLHNEVHICFVYFYLQVALAADSVPLPARALLDTSSSGAAATFLTNDHEMFNVHCKLVNDLEEGVYSVHNELDNLLDCLIGTSIQVGFLFILTFYPQISLI